MGARSTGAGGLMAGGEPEDVLRSLRRYVAQTLGSPPWTVRIQRTRVLDDERPIAVVEEGGPLTTPRSRAGMVNQGDVQLMQSYAVMCYPAMASDAADSRYEAGRVRSLLQAGFSRGLVTDDDPPVNIGAPWSVPVYDFDGVPVSGEGRAGPADSYMYASVDQTFNVRPVQDPLDELRFTVVANLRMTWWAGGRIPPAAPLVESMTPGFAPSGWKGSGTVRP